MPRHRFRTVLAFGALRTSEAFLTDITSGFCTLGIPPIVVAILRQEVLFVIVHILSLIHI